MDLYMILIEGRLLLIFIILFAGALVYCRRFNWSSAGALVLRLQFPARSQRPEFHFLDKLNQN